MCLRRERRGEEGAGRAEGLPRGSTCPESKRGIGRETAAGAHASAALSAPRKISRYQKVIRKVKKRARSELRGRWSEHRYAATPPRAALLGAHEDIHSVRNQIPVLDGNTLSFAEFSHCIEKRNVPCVIKHLLRHWPAMKTWTSSEALLRDCVPQEYGCKVGSDDDGYAVRLKYKYFHRYIHDASQGAQDDSPLYIFDSGMLQETGMTKDYIVPHVFSEDLLKYAGEDRRPPYRWICVGGARSGTSIHVDPLGTSAWNALIVGHKRWALFPPGSVPKSVLKPKDVNSAVRWFDRVWPATQEAAWEAQGYPKPIEVVQRPGEVVFVPSGWWHVVLNLDFTVAVTHNFCSTSNFAEVFRHTRVSRPKMSVRWLEGLRAVRPDVYEVGKGIVERGERCHDASSPSEESTSEESEESEE
jgi:histone arginine demethylase JMJD6